MNSYKEILEASIEYYDSISKIAGPPAPRIRMPSRIKARTPRLKPKFKPRMTRPVSEPHTAPSTKPQAPKTKFREPFRLDKNGKPVINENLFGPDGKLRPGIDKKDLRNKIKAAQKDFLEKKKLKAKERAKRHAENMKIKQNKASATLEITEPFKYYLNQLSSTKAKMGYATAIGLGALYLIFSGSKPTASASSPILQKSMAQTQMPKANMISGKQLAEEINKINSIVSKNSEEQELSANLSKLQSITLELSGGSLDISQTSQLKNFAQKLKQFDEQAAICADSLSDFAEQDPTNKEQIDQLIMHLTDFFDNIEASRRARSIT